MPLDRKLVLVLLRHRNPLSHFLDWVRDVLFGDISLWGLVRHCFSSRVFLTCQGLPYVEKSRVLSPCRKSDNVRECARQYAR